MNTPDEATLQERRLINRRWLLIKQDTEKTIMDLHERAKTLIYASEEEIGEIERALEAIKTMKPADARLRLVQRASNTNTPVEIVAEALGMVEQLLRRHRKGMK